MYDRVKELYNNDLQLEELKEYFKTHFDKYAIQMMYEGHDVSHIKDAWTLTKGVFHKMRVDFEPKRTEKLKTVR